MKHIIKELIIGAICGLFGAYISGCDSPTDPLKGRMRAIFQRAATAKFELHRQHTYCSVQQTYNLLEHRWYYACVGGALAPKIEPKLIDNAVKS